MTLDTKDPQSQAKQIIVDYFNRMSEVTDDFTLTVEDVYVVWFSKTLQNWKALLSTTVPDGMYYELTYDGDRQATYLDAYKKFKNVTILDPERKVKSDRALEGLRLKLSDI